MRQTGGDANLLRKGAHKLMKHFLDDYPQVQLVVVGHSQISVFCTKKLVHAFCAVFILLLMTLQKVANLY